jgi:disulfide bond formation protein DsbB
MNPFHWSFRSQFLLGFAICGALLGYAFYVQFQLGIEPCPFCIFQRIAFAALGIVFLIGGLHAPRAPGGRKAWSLLGVRGRRGSAPAISGRHSWVQLNPAGDAQLWSRPELHRRAAFLALGAARKVLLATGDCSAQHRLEVPRPEHADVVPGVLRRARAGCAVCRFQTSPSPSVPPVTVAGTRVGRDDALPHPVIIDMSSVPAVSLAPPPPAANDPWAPGSWRAKPALQLPQYPDATALAAAQDELRALPPLVTSWEILALKQQLAEAQEGKRFLLQGGDCAETFAECNAEIISNRLKVLLQMSLVLVHGLKLPVVRVGRFAGQYAKPRSADLETKGERDPAELPRRHGQRTGIHSRSAHPGSAPDDQGACALGDDDELRAFADRWRLRRPAPSGILGTWAGSASRRTRSSTRRWSPASAMPCASWRRWPAGRCTTSTGSISTPRTKPCCCRTRRRKRARCRASRAGST